jgi:tetratricopeptide (TPR) repeat protein
MRPHLALFLILTCCQSPSEQQRAQHYVPNEKAVQLNEEATDIIRKNLFEDTLNVSLLNDGLRKLDEAISVDSQYVYSYLNKATIFKALKLYNNAREEYELAAKFDTDNPELIFSQGLMQEKMNRSDSAQIMYSKALMLYNRLIEDQPDNLDFKVSRAFIFLFTHGKDEALSQISYVEPRTDQEKSEVEQMTALIRDFQRDEFVSNF